MIVADIHKKLNIGSGEATLSVNLQARKGSITLIHGPSGAGKTTFLKVIGGLTLPQQGKIMVEERVWLDTSAGINLSPQKRLAGFVFQNYALFPNMTARQHLEYATPDTAWIEKLLSLGDLQNHATHKPDQLSGGQQQRLAILRAMAIKPAVLLMDEPFSALDQKTKGDLITNLKAFWDDMQTTVLMVSHNPQEFTGLFTDQLYIGPAT